MTAVLLAAVLTVTPPVHDSWETVPHVRIHDSWTRTGVHWPAPVDNRQPVVVGSVQFSRPAPPTTPTVVEDWRPLVASFFPADQVDKALHVMACESGGNPYAYNPSGAAGLFQMMPHWYQGRSAYPAFDPFDPVANVAAAAWLWGQLGWGQWVCQ